MRGLLRLLRTNPDVVEADLSRYHHIDYRDRWRFDDQGRRRLTLRMIAARVRHLPPESATAVSLGGAAWSTTDYLLSDLFHATAGAPHPSRPKPGRRVDSPERLKKKQAALRRRRERQRAIAAGEL